MSKAINRSAVTRMLGVLLLVLGASLIPSVVVGLIYGEIKEVTCFLGTALPCLVVGFIIFKKYNPTDLKTKQRESYLIATMFWIVLRTGGHTKLSGLRASGCSVPSEE